MPGKLLFLLYALLALPGSLRAEEAPLQVVVSILPEQFLVERVAGPRADILTLVQPGDNPATYSPGPATLAALDDGQVWFTLGVHFEQVWRERITRDRPELEVVDLAAGLQRRQVEQSWASLGHGHDHDHGHAGMPDPHTWTDPRLAARMAATIADTLARLDPAGADGYRARSDTLQQELLELHEEIAARLAPVRGQAFIVFHPSWGYFADAYGLQQLPIEIGGREPGPRGLAELIELGRETDARAVFVQRQFSQRTARAVADALGAEIVEADPLALDYIENLREVSIRVAEALAPEAAP
ncbi:zinc ABC transporter substrate-binding protein [Thioalkalivibrio sp. XN8]|uniref:metal ABC transporter solute-binding protein, Zn/Mn family n=1 Tax=Thioalkalivibrio sp. XN8 TaxID=2712863 RepID=UPI0013E9FDA2|nr:zinc ABC transporter substrate-binding protein [Thioalkalivibrio sp. XN8]NGP53015.1 zinc ABC transporter solute-binding protein [Thioalkalivibrio sp. XN8]